MLKLTFGLLELEADAMIKGLEMREERIRLVVVGRAELVFIV